MIEVWLCWRFVMCISAPCADQRCCVLRHRRHLPAPLWQRWPHGEDGRAPYPLSLFSLLWLLPVLRAAFALIHPVTAEGHHDSALTHFLHTVISLLGVADHKVSWAPVFFFHLCFLMYMIFSVVPTLCATNILSYIYLYVPLLPVRVASCCWWSPCAWKSASTRPPGSCRWRSVVLSVSTPSTTWFPPWCCSPGL